MDMFSSRFSRAKSTLATLVLMAADLLALCIALSVAFILLFDGHQTLHLPDQLLGHATSLLLGLPLFLLLFAAARLYRHAWRFASLEMIWGVVLANTGGVLALYSVQYFLYQNTFPRSVLFIFWLLSIMLVGGTRILLRLVNLGRMHGRNIFHLLRRQTNATRTVILGGGWDGARLLRAIHEEFGGRYQVIGFLDDQPEKQGVYIRGVRVLGPLQHVYTLLRNHAVDEVLIAIPDTDGADIRDYVLACRQQHIPVKIIPGLRDVVHGTARARLEDITVEDLLRRPPVCLDTAQIGHYVTGKCVLVTGAGGSIGSELCRQILAQQPDRLILLGHGENSIHTIHQELTIRFPHLVDRLSMVIASVADERRIAHVFSRYQPQVVFHAAAHKHVPIMEDNVSEAVQNNVFGTRCIAEACGRHQVERMVLISTDKAVFPSSVMGATKWLCEEVVRSLAPIYLDTKYIAVRFGNVLGSRGSVVPIFKEQIRRGGPVTVTHPEMTRYFMTIPEAVTLVLQAGAIGNTGQLFLLDMGNPVKILDLAEDMIRLCGYEPGKDIEIVFTGLRPGEKLHEQLAMDETHLQPAACERMSMITRPPTYNREQLHQLITQLQQLVANNETAHLMTYLGDIVPGFGERQRFAVDLTLEVDQAEDELVFALQGQ